MSVGYFILAHEDPEQLGRLIETLRSETAGPILVHLDRKSAPQFGRIKDRLASQNHVRFISTRRVAWGAFNAVEATLDGCAAMLRLWPHLTHIQHLSGLHYPIRPLREFEDWIERLGHGSAFEFHSLPYEKWDQGHGVDRVRKIWLLKHRRRSIALPFRRKLPDHIRLYGGSAFWCLSKTHLLRILDSKAELRRIFAHSLLPDEIYFQTAAHSFVPSSELVNALITFTQWEDRAPSPSLLTEQHLPAMRKSPSFFARKFDSEFSRALLDELDAIRKGGSALHHG